VIRVISRPSGVLGEEERASGSPLVTIAGWRYRTYIYYYYNMAAHNNIMRSSYTYIYYYYNTLVYGYVKRTSGVKIYGPV